LTCMDGESGGEMELSPNLVTCKYQLWIDQGFTYHCSECIWRSECGTKSK
jgi:hypothetical protein